ncbi:MAG: FmdB family zinc ribbon protein [Bacillota bacterium]
MLLFERHPANSSALGRGLCILLPQPGVYVLQQSFSKPLQTAPYTLLDYTGDAWIPARFIARGLTGAAPRAKLKKQGGRIVPIYEFRCVKCSKRFEKLCEMGETGRNVKCPQCGACNPNKLISGFCSPNTEGGKGSCGGCTASSCSGCH